MVYTFALILSACLITLSVIDIRDYRLPDLLTLPLIAAGLAQAYWLHGGELGLRPSLIGAAVGYSAFVALEIAYRALRGKEGLGRGDAKLLAAGGAWCGWAGLPFIVLIASGCGLVALLFPAIAKKAQQEGALPFGPFLAFGIGCVWAAQQMSRYPL